MKKIFALSIFVGFIFLANTVFAENYTDTASLIDIIKQLQEQVKLLQSQVEQLTIKLETTNKDVDVIKEQLLITKTLKLGMSDKEVTTLQKFLSTMPDIYPEGIVTGYFGPLTEQAVKKLQEKNGLENVGVVGPKTRLILNELSSVIPTNNSPTTPTFQISTNTTSSTTPIVITTSTNTIATTSTVTTNPTPTSTPPPTPPTPPTPAPAPAPTPSSDTTPPSTPTNLSVSGITQDQINLSWTASTDNVAVVGYNIYRNNSLIAQNVTSTSSYISTSYLHTGLSSNTSYNFGVSAFDAVGNTSSQANITTSTLAPTPPPTTSLELGISTYGGNSPVIRAAGSTYQVQIRFENMSEPCTGCDVTPATSVTAYYTPNSGGTHYEEEKFAVPQLNRAGVVWLTWNHTLGAPAGEYNFVVVIDPDNTVAEKNESNNIWPFTFTITQ